MFVDKDRSNSEYSFALTLTMVVYGCQLSLVLVYCLVGLVLGDEKVISLSLPLADDGSLPRLGLGTAGMREKTRSAVYRSLSVGISLVDTAQASEWYDEESTGLGIKDYVESSSTSPNNIVIVTKIHPRSFEMSRMRRKLIESRDLLHNATGNINTLEVVLLHSSHCWSGHCTEEEEQISWQSGWMNLEIMKRDGYVKHIGVSNFGVSLLQELKNIATMPVSVVQNWMDPFHQDIEVRNYCKENGIVYMAYSSFGTQWTAKLQHNPVWFNPVLEAIAKKHETTIANVVLSWLLQEGVIAIPRATRDSHIKENAAALVEDDQGQVVGLRVFLDDEDMQDIRELDGILGSLWDGDTDL
jgi:diketogulonate reductase-like aldo/keto reductase